MCNYLKNIIVCSLFLLIAFFKISWASEQEIYVVTFKNGEILSGTIAYIDSEEIFIQTGKEQIVQRKFREVLSIDPLSKYRMEKPVAPFHGDIFFAGGVKNFRRSDYYPANRSLETGISLQIEKERWPVALSAGILYANGSGRLNGDVFSVKSIELSLGAIKQFKIFKTVTPFLGTGAASFRVESEQKGGVDVKKSRNRLGAYLETGLKAALWKRGFAGAGFRYSLARASYETERGHHDARLGGVHITGFIGYEW